MKIKKIFTLLTASVLITSTLLVGCGKDSNKSEEASGTVKDKIVYALNTSPTGVFNPLISNTTYDGAVNSLIYTGLLGYDKDYNFQPELAEDYNVSDDGLTYTFNLKKDLKWQDGKPLTVKDVEYTFKALANKDYDGSLKSAVERIKGVKDFADGKIKDVEGIKVLDDDTIQFTFEKPYSVALGDIGTTPIIPEHIWGDISPANWKESSDLLLNPIGSGPYKLTKFDSGQSVEFEKNDNYYGNKPKTERFIFKVTNPDTVQGELENGTVDIADISTLKKSEQDDIKSQGFNIVSYPQSGILYMGMNLRKDKFKDVKVRQAIDYAINKKEALEKLAEGTGTAVSVPMLPTSWAYPKDGELNDYEYNVDKAKELLKEAGWEDRDGDGIIENSNNEKFQVKLHCPSGRKDQEQRALLVQSNLKDVGIGVDISTMEFSTLMQQVVGNHDFDMYLMLNNLPIDPDPTAYWSSKAASDEKNTFAWNISSYKNPEADKLMEEGLSTNDKEKRKEIYGEYAKIMNRDVPWVCFFAPNTIQATNAKLKNYNPNTSLNFLNVEDWYIEE
ncbi:peptide-binding protein [Clostridium fallax]|uniref:Peptide/nickel transport system substrate-binding protein n=1 Tax=Clostridium fallax TaxID=1533 RepID=A0A1M4ZKJ0_9CLOT|nr:peptide-binding protein [Clostridium fallax]SHF18511.1 peptide/nickel transport system substrate-binding protein [Clostridium fallax]SQB06013.1 extracellular solute-binding protein [Clostridium fallax]